MYKYNSEELYKLVKSLTGPVDPVGETYQDTVRFQNLKTITELVDKLVTDIDNVAYVNKDRIEYSRKEAGKFATEFLDALGIKN